MTKQNDNDIFEFLVAKEVHDSLGKFGEFLGILYYLGVGVVIVLMGLVLLFGGLSSLAHSLFAQ